MSKKVVAGNFKMNKTESETKIYIKKLRKLVKKCNNDVIICVPFTDLKMAIKLTKGSNIRVGAQNMHYEKNGAFTGEISPIMLKEMGVQYVIIGHSERRTYFNETDESINLKLKKALEYDLKPILCVGETLQQREEEKTVEILSNQIKLDFKDLTKEQAKNIIIAYEPIWAIGTGKTASSQDANDSILSIRKELAKIYDENTAKEIVIQYGGSVKSNNSKELFDMEQIDGGLVGGACLDPIEFSKICNY